jgi:hypothetical protein
MRAARAAFGFLLAAGLAAGCGASGTADVSGTVSYDGKPIERGSITFIPADGNAATAGAQIENGKYAAAKVPTGTAKVVISGAKVTERKIVYDNPTKPTVVTADELLPPKYSNRDTSELRYEVQRGQQVKDFNLEK